MIFLMAAERMILTRRTAMIGRKASDSPDRPSTVRRALLTGGAASLAAVAGTTLGRSQPASAAANPSITDWINAVTDPRLTNPADPTGARDSAPGINAAIQLALTAPSQVVYLESGTYLLKSPLVIQAKNVQNNGVCIYGAHGANASGDGAGSDIGTVLVVASTFTNPNWPASSLPGTPANWAGAAILCLDQSPGTGGNPTRGIRIKDIWIDCSTNGVPANVDGITCFGAVQNCTIANVGVFNSTGNGMGFYQDTGPGVTFQQPFPDGFTISDCMLQGCAGIGFNAAKLNDSQIYNVHAQSCGGDGFTIQGGNNVFVACRADHNNNGFTTDVSPGGKFDDNVVLIGCGTEANQANGLNIVNPGGTYHTPVLVTGCHFCGDGVNNGLGGGGFAGIAVSGVSTVSIANTRVMVRTADVAGGCPQYGLATGTPGVPASIVMSSGFLGYAGSQAVNDAAGVGPNLIIGPAVTSAAGLHPASFTQFPLTLAGPFTAAGSAISISNAASTNSAPIYYIAFSGTDSVFGLRVSGDSSNRWAFDANGKLQWGSGTASPDCRLLRSAANLLAVQLADLDIGTAGHGLRVAEGTNCKQGIATLSGGTVIVANTSITANSRIFLTAQDNNTTGTLRVSARTASRSFTIQSSVSTDSGVVAYQIFEPG
jgi:hypothetical protein